MPEPTIEIAEACIGAARSFAPDGVVAVGGGSNMDLAKATATVLAHGGAPRDFLGEGKVPGPILPLICLPTTAGTGSEVTFAAVLTDTVNKVKMPILSNYLRPAVAIVDPALTVSCPRKVTADAGIDALTHAIEAFTAIDNERFPLPAGEESVYQGRNLVGAALAEKAIELVGTNLVTAVERPDDLAARSAMSLAATLGGLAFSNIGVALVHALEAAVGGALHCPHGAGNGTLLPFVMRYNLAAAEETTARVAALLGRDTSTMTELQAAEAAIETVEALNRKVGIPQRLREYGMKEEHIRPFAEKAFAAKRILRVSPRYPTLADLEQILRQAL
jgi:alcohol dehydrogenase class IV